MFDTSRLVNSADAVVRTRARSARRSARRVPLSPFALVAVVVLACPRGLPAEHVERAAETTPFVRGVGLGLFASDPEYDYGVLLDEIRAHGATDVLIALSWYQDDVRAHEMRPRTGYSPSTKTLERTLAQARAKGLRVAVLPIVRLTHRTRDEWRGRIAPTAGVDAWFLHYRAYLMEVATIAARHDVARLSVGSELLSLERHEAHWRALIDDVRGVFRGKLLYSANWDHFEPIRFWDALDEVGVTAYFELSHDEGTRDRASFVAAWTRPRIDLLRLKRVTNKPLLLTEVGYPSRTSAAIAPWDETRRSPVDVALQATLYDAFCEAFRGQAVVDGFYFWNWFGFGGAEDTTYTPRQKPAAERLRACLADRRWDAPAEAPPHPPLDAAPLYMPGR